MHCKAVRVRMNELKASGAVHSRAWHAKFTILPVVLEHSGRSPINVTDSGLQISRTFIFHQIVAKNVPKCLQALSLQHNSKIQISCQNLAKITQFFIENEYFKCVWDTIQKQIIFTNFTYNIYKFVTILHVPMCSMHMVVISSLRNLSFFGNLYIHAWLCLSNFLYFCELRVYSS